MRVPLQDGGKNVSNRINPFLIRPSKRLGVSMAPSLWSNNIEDQLGKNQPMSSERCIDAQVQGIVLQRLTPNCALTFPQRRIALPLDPALA